MNYGLRRLIGFDETGFDGAIDTPYRIQAWDFILAGGGHFNHLDYSFTVGHEDGTFAVPATQPGAGSPALRRQLKTLLDFMEGFDYVHMTPTDELMAGGVPEGASRRLLAQAGRAYAVYLHHGKPLPGHTPAYAVERTPQRARLALNIPAGHWRARWWNPRTAKIDTEETLEHRGGLLWLHSPEYSEDVALALTTH